MSEPRIVVLPPEVAEKIAAGEVIERPSSVVKELVENALDAGATRITIETEAGGKALIRVTDDGSGMTSDEAQLAVQAHATSKLRTADDLFTIRTLGFRGEALPSIAAISHFELVTRPREGVGYSVLGVGESPDRTPNTQHPTPNTESEATRVRIEGGRLQAVDTIVAPSGTSVTARELFFNLPARQKFLRSDNAEATQITDLVQRLAMSHSAVTFRLVHDGREILLSPASEDPLNAIVAVLGRPIARELLRIPEFRGERIAVTGFAARPTLTRANRAHQLLYINGRTIRSPLYYRALDEAYRATMPSGRYPVAVVFVQIAAHDVDVNVHPSKLEVRFRDDNSVYVALVTALQAALRPAAAPADAQTGMADPDDPFADVPASPLASGTVREAPRVYDTAAPPAATQPFWPRPEDVLPGSPDLPSGDASVQGSGSTPFADSALTTGLGNWRPTRPSLTPRPPGSWDRELSSGQEAGTADSSEADSRQPGTHEVGDADSPAHPDLASLRPLGQARDLFVIAEGAGRFWILDQHVIHERILFERLTDPNRTEAEPTEPLLIPLTLQLDNRQALVLEEYREALGEMGYEIEPFGKESFVVRGIPRSLLGRNYEQALRDTVDELTDLSQGGRVQLRREQLAMAAAGRACKAAMKAGQPLSLAEMQRLLEELAACRNPYTCPHGRPVFLAFEPAEIAKLFGEAKCE